MKTKRRALILATIIVAAVSAAGCPSTPVTNSPGTNAPPANTDVPKTENVNRPEPANTNSGSSTGSLATPTEAYKTAFEVRKNKDAAGLRRVLSKEILEFFTEMGKLDNRTLDDMMKELAEKPQAPSAETRNEKITGDRAILEYKDENGAWKEMDFVKEDGEWKLTLPKADGPGTGTGGPPKKP